jgi:Coenzyme PQQ synthesis protein D (PqqD)
VRALPRLRPVRVGGVTLRRSAGEIMLYDPKADRIHLVNTTAAAIWDLCDGETDPQEMVGAICQLTGMPETIVEEDVAGLLEGFAEAGLIAWSDDEDERSGPGS